MMQEIPKTTIANHANDRQAIILIFVMDLGARY